MALLLLTLAALLVHGYHPFAEDAEIYLPGVEKILYPQLFPGGEKFFASHASMTIFPNLIAFSLRVLHLPMTAGLFLWQAASIFLFLLACWQLSGQLFASARARWGAVCMLAALLTLPVAGTALYIMDQYVNPRNLAAFAAIFAVTRTLEKKYLRAALWLAFAGSVHLLMASFAFSFCVLFTILQWFEQKSEGLPAAAFASWCSLLPFGISLRSPTSPAYHAAAQRHLYHYIQNWAWYEQLGIVGPVVLFWWFARIARARQWRNLKRVCWGVIIFDLTCFFAALIVDLPARFETLARVQPLRSLHLVYMLLFLIIGGLLGEFVLKNRIWRWLLLFLPLSLGMFLAQRSLFAASAHVEWPGTAPRNQWQQAFLWVRDNTPVDAMFSLDPDYLRLPGEEITGFRCLAQRNRLADMGKDAGAVSMFPPLGDEWWKQVQAQTPWKSFRLADFERLKKTYGVNWVVVQQPGVAGLDCPYRNAAVEVCRVP